MADLKLENNLIRKHQQTSKTSFINIETYLASNCNSISFMEYTKHKLIY